MPADLKVIHTAVPQSWGTVLVCVVRERKHLNRIHALSVLINHLKDDLNETNTNQRCKLSSRDYIQRGLPVTCIWLEEQYLGFGIVFMRCHFVRLDNAELHLA